MALPKIRALVAAAVMIATTSAYALPTLNLESKTASRRGSDETSYSTGKSFTLYAFLESGKDIPDFTSSYYVSAAVSPAISSAASLGSFSFNGNPVDVTADMDYGTPRSTQPTQRFLRRSPDAQHLPHLLQRVRIHVP